eukprot:scaffold81048_cov49-Phaeocystis_antarctica.AAC.1
MCTACASHLTRLPAEQLYVHGTRAAPPLAPCACVPVGGVMAGRRTTGQGGVALVRSAVGGWLGLGL